MACDGRNLYWRILEDLGLLELPRVWPRVRKKIEQGPRGQGRYMVGGVYRMVGVVWNGRESRVMLGDGGKSRDRV